VVKPLKTEEELKANIFTVYSKYRDEPSSDQRQVYFGQLCDYVFRWCTNYEIFPEAREMGVEIFEALERIVKREIEEKHFFGYLVTTIKNAKNEYYRKNISNNIKYPRIIRDIEKFISLQENNAERILTEEEKIERVSKWFNKSPKKAREYLGMIDNKNIDSLTYYDNEDKDIPDSKNDPESIFFSNISVQEIQENAAIIREVLKSVLLKKQDRSRECYRALFTAYFINNSNDFEGIASVLNAEILEKYLKDGKKPEQYEVYKMYHPEVTKESAGVRASEMLKTLLDDIKTALKSKKIILKFLAKTIKSFKN